MIKIERDLDPNGEVKISTHCIDNNEGILKAKEKIEQKELELKLVEKQAREAEKELFELVAKQLKEKNLKFEDGEVIWVSGCNFYIIYFYEQFYFMSNSYNFYNKEELSLYAEGFNSSKIL